MRLTGILQGVLKEKKRVYHHNSVHCGSSSVRVEDARLGSKNHVQQRRAKVRSQERRKRICIADRTADGDVYHWRSCGNLDAQHRSGSEITASQFRIADRASDTDRRILVRHDLWQWLWQSVVSCWLSSSTKNLRQSQDAQHGISAEWSSQRLSVRVHDEWRTSNDASSWLHLSWLEFVSVDSDASSWRKKLVCGSVFGHQIF